VHEDVREAILDAVGRLLKRYGYGKMTVDDIAREAAVGKGTIYLYFPSKKEMALGWIDRAHDQLHNELRKIAGSGEAPPDKLCRILKKRVTSRIDTARNCVQSFDELFAAVRPDMLARRDHNHKVEALILAEVVKDGCDRGIFASDDHYETAYCLLLATNYLLPYSLKTNQLGGRKEIEEKLKKISRLLLHGMIVRSDRNIAVTMIDSEDDL